MNRIDRITDINWVDWLSSAVLPDKKLWAMISESVPAPRGGGPDTTGLKRVLFNGRYWMTRDAFEAWRPAPDKEEPITALIAKAGGGNPKVIDGLSLVEYDEGQADELATLAEISRMELNVNLVRVYKPQPNASGALSGKILAVSKNFAAQSIGGNGVVFHEQDKLSRKLAAGENVTLNYDGGRATVYNGCFFDVQVTSNYLNTEQLGWLRMNMIEALSSVEGAETDDAMIQEALHFALDKTAGMYEGVRTDMPKSGIKLTVQDVMPQLQMQVADLTGLEVERADDGVKAARQIAGRLG